MTIVRVDMSFTVDKMMPPPHQPIHDALLSLRCIEVEAPSVEAGEHYANLLMLALEKAGS